MQWKEAPDAQRRESPLLWMAGKGREQSAGGPGRQGARGGARWIASRSGRLRLWGTGLLGRQLWPARLPVALSAASAPPSTACAPNPLFAARSGTAFPERFSPIEISFTLLFRLSSSICISLLALADVLLLYTRGQALP